VASPPSGAQNWIQANRSDHPWRESEEGREGRFTATRRERPPARRGAKRRPVEEEQEEEAREGGVSQVRAWAMLSARRSWPNRRIHSLKRPATTFSRPREGEREDEEAEEEEEG